MRSNDLIWSNVVNNYLMGNKPPAFDLLYWNSDGTRMTRAAHSWYLRNTYLENNLIKPGKIELLGQPIDLGRIKQDIYAVGAEKDHIVPWYAAWRITQLAGRQGALRAGLQRAYRRHHQPSRPQGCLLDQRGGTAAGDAGGMAGRARPTTRAAGGRTGSPGSATRSGEKVKPPPVGSKAHPPLADAPGTYVLEK